MSDHSKATRFLIGMGLGFIRHTGRIPRTDCPRITADFIAQEERSLGR